MKKSSNIIIGLIALILVFIPTLIGLYTDFLWFESIGFETIFTVSLFTKIKLFAIAAIFVFLFTTINLWISKKINKENLIPFKFKILITSIIAFFGGLAFSNNWFNILQYINQVPFGLKDPIFTKEVSFYIFSLPFYSVVLNFVIGVFAITLLLVMLDYLKSYIQKALTETVPDSEMINVTKSRFKEIFAKNKLIAHLGILGSILFVLIAAKHYISRFSIMYSEQGIVVGAGYTDVMVFLPMVKFLMIFALVVAVGLLIWAFFIAKRPKLRKKHIVVSIIAFYLIFGLIGPGLITGLVQSFKVSPNEINLEKPYIENNIEFTKIAYGLDNVEEKAFPVNLDLTSEVLANESETIDNVRILDWRPLTKTYKQTQEIRLYYDLAGIDIDRYNINDKYTQVMLAPRELDQSQIASNAKTWVNIHMVYTHGYGIVMSPVNKVTEQGLPEYFIQDVPPVYSVDGLTIDKPQIYYGEKGNNFVLVNTKTKEFDYPKGNTNEYINYDGKGGIVLDSFGKKLAMALKFGDLKILLTSEITPESKIMFTRKILDRVHKLTPFIQLDDDPYLVINDGRLSWIIEGYTASGNFPYSEKIGGINYIRNSVKIVVDAYDGTVEYFIVDENDPIIMTYNNIFPDQFKSFDEMSETLKEHIRYPVDLFKIQSEIYNTYHMDDIKVFYNKEDAWQNPTEIYGVGQQVKVEPYYIIMKLPGEEKEEFVLMSSFSPIRKDNMVAWMGARSDGENYGKLTLYKFPKDKLVYGPLQIEARIDQDSEISQQLTLWSQKGSSVTRGNLLVIPIRDSIIYIEPLYIQAETGQMPELKRVLVSDGVNVVMENDLETALKVLFDKSDIIDESIEDVDKTISELVNDAKNYYELIENSMKDGDWSGFGDNFNKLGQTLETISVE